MTPDDELPHELRERLREELDSLPLAAPSPAQARYGLLPGRTGGWGVRIGMVAAGAVTTFAVGLLVSTLNPAVRNSHTAGSMHSAAATSPSPRVMPSPSPSGDPTPPATAGPAAPAGAQSTSGSHESPEPASTPGEGATPEPSSPTDVSASPTPDN